MSSLPPFTPTLRAHVDAPASDRTAAVRSAVVPLQPMRITVPDEPLRLPDLAEPARRGPLPLLASLVPILGGVVLWLVTGSMTMLWFAALGPLIAVATLIDGRRAARRDRARRQAEAAQARERVSRLIDERHDRERDRLWARHPDVASAVAADVVWTGTSDRRSALVVGAGPAPSDVRVSGGEGDPDSLALRARARVLDHAPVTVPIGIGVAVVGPAAVASAVLRALVAQVLVAFPPGDVRLAGDPHGETEWLLDAPHRRAEAGATMAVCGPGEPVPEADIVLVRTEPGSPVPPRCGAVLTLTGIARASLAVGADAVDVDTEALSLPQAEELALVLDDRASALFGSADATADIPLADLVGAHAGDPGAGLSAVVGTAGRSTFAIDLVADGPHAVVVGMTGAGKSELLISWVTALCATRTPDQVSFLLADFKGGTAFDALRSLPHVTGVITDLDGSGARRALQSLSAELRWREAQLVRAGARDIRDERVRMPRLVVIVDEFAALLAEHPELQAVFTDVAARGRALGMHLVLGTQRAAGVLRDALLSNCPLRICLRVVDAADSRAVVGIDAAAQLPGGAEGRGTALILRAGDAAPTTVRIARAGGELIRDVASRARAMSDTEPRRPWLPELPSVLTRGDLPPVADGDIVLGLADEPDQQRQVPVLLGDRGLFVVGRPGSGRTTALAAIAEQVSPNLRVQVAADPEAAWDAIAALSSDDPWGETAMVPGTVVLIDDLDSLLGSLPPEYSQAAADRIERLVRSASGRGIRIVASAQRLSGAVARIADGLPRRTILATASRMDHIAAGGDPRDTLPDRPGRALLDGRTMQWLDAAPVHRAAPDPTAEWQPGARPTALVVRAGSRDALAGFLRGRGIEVCAVDELAARSAADLPAIILGDPDAWLRNWRVLADARADRDLLIDAACAGEYRAITADRELPPYCAPGRGRAWLIRPGEAAQRVMLPRRAPGDAGGAESTAIRP